MTRRNFIKTIGILASSLAVAETENFSKPEEFEKYSDFKLSDIETNKWVHVAVTRTDPNPTLYIDGVIFGHVKDFDGTVDKIIKVTEWNNVRVHLPIVTTDTFSIWLNVDEMKSLSASNLRVYDRKLNQKEIESLYAEYAL